MRRFWAGTVVLAALLSGCDGGDDAMTELAVTTPAGSATAAAPTSPAPTSPAPTAAPTSAPGAPTAVPTGSTGPAQAYAILVGDWQSARAEFFAAVSAGRPLTARDQNLLAGRFLAAQRRFGTALRSYPWPAPAAPAVRRLRAENGVQEHFIVGMTRAGTAAEFTSGLASYGVGAAAENRALAAVSTALN